MSDSPEASGPGQPSDQPPFYQPPETQPAYPPPAFQQPPTFQQPPGLQQPGFQQPGTQQPGIQQPAYQPPADATPAWSPAPGTGLEPAASGEPVLVSIGDISVTQTKVFTPSGARDLNEVSWTVTDMSVTSQNIPTWAIVCAIIFFVFCLLGLLFLLVKETTTKGSLQVTVHGPGFVHTTQVPVFSQAQVADINARVNYARTLTASYAPPQPGWQAPPGDQAPGIGWQQPGQGR